MPETKPTNHLEGLVLEAKALEGKTSKKEFRKVKIGSLWLSCFEVALYPLMVKGKYLAVDYTTTQGEKYTNYTIQAARESVAPASSIPELSARGPERPPVAPAGGMDRERSIEAQVAAYCTAQVVAATGSTPEGELAYNAVKKLIRAFYDGIQEAKAHTGGAASTTGQSPPFSKPAENPAPETKDAPAGPGAPPPTLTIPDFGKDWGLFMIWAGERFGFDRMSQVNDEFTKRKVPKSANPQEVASLLTQWLGAST